MTTGQMVSDATGPQATRGKFATLSYSRKHTAIVIDDDLDSLEILCGLLGLYQISAQTTNDSVNAPELIRLTQPGFIITDLLMPCKDGWYLLSEIKQDASIQHIPVLAITAYSGPTLVADALKAGFKACIAKPVTPIEFYKVIKRMLAND